MKTIKKLTLLVLAVFALSACSNDDDVAPVINSGPTLNIVGTAQANADLSILVDAVIQAGLVDALSASGNRTVFAPTNAAFTTFLQDKGYASLEVVPDNILAQILLNHVIDGENIPSSALAGNAGYRNTLASGPNSSNLSIYYNGTNGVVLNGSSTVTAADVATTNGIVHVVNKVIDTPTLLTFATADANFNVLEMAVTNANQAAVASALTNATPTDPLTVFAPVDSAFVALLDSNTSWNSLEDIDNSLLTSVLTHHVVSGNIASGNLTPNGDTTAPTVQGQNITITLPGTAPNIADMTDGAGNTDIGIIAVDVQASNGVIHAINKVLLPMQQ